MQAVQGWALLAATLLAFCAAVHANTHSTAAIISTAKVTPLKDWLAVLHASAAAHPASYRQLHKDYACFKPASICGAETWNRASLRCCEGHGSGNDVLEPGPKVGTCTLLVNQDNLTPLNVTDTTVEGAPFNAICTLDHNADVCGPSGCEDLVLQAQGNTYVTLAATSLPPPSLPPQALACQGNFNVSKTRSWSGPDFQNAARVPGPGPTNPSKKQVHYGPALIYSGPMTVRSETHDAKWKEGWFDLVVPLYTDWLWGQGPISELPGKPLYVDPEDFWTYKLEFNRPEESSHGYEEDRA